MVAGRLAKLAAAEGSAPEFTVTFTEDKEGFHINGKRYSPDDTPMARVRIGGYHHWRIVNKTRPEWLDTVNVPIEASVDHVGARLG